MRNIQFTGTLQTLKYIITRREIFDLFLDEEKSNDLPPVSFQDVVLLLIFLLGVIFLSVIILFFEILVHRVLYRKERMKRRKRIVIQGWYRNEWL